MTISVASAGLLTTVQDLGRVGFRQHGVSSGGALDPYALTIANLVIANEPAAAGLEMTFGTAQLKFAENRLVAWCGGDFDVETAGIKLAAGHAALVCAGEEMRVNAPAGGGRAWCAFSGGIDVPAVLGSRATDLRSRFGGFDGRPLVDGDVLRLGHPTTNASNLAKRLAQSRITSWSAPSEWASTKPHHPFLRIVRGEDWVRFDPAVTSELVQGSFTVTGDSDRMGVRLDGPRISRHEDGELVSETVAPGTIQIPPNGQPIVLLGDCQTIGGYPKIAHVISVDLPAAAQLSPADVVRFAEVSLSEAHALLIERARELAWFRAGVARKFA